MTLVNYGYGSLDRPSRRLVQNWAPTPITGSVKTLTEPTVEPVSIYEFKVHSHAFKSGDVEDPLILLFIKAARERLELYLNRAFIAQTLRLTFDEWTDRRLYLPRAPATAVSAIKSIDFYGVETVLDGGNYRTIFDTEPAVIDLGTFWPGGSPFFLGGLRRYWQVDYVAGVPTAGDVLAAIKIKILEWATIMYDSRRLDTSLPQSWLDSVAELIVTRPA